MKIKISFLIILIALFTPLSTFAQACSCGGAPLLSSLELPSTPRSVWQFGFTYEFNSISDLVVGSTKLDDDTRIRSVHSGKLEIGYGLTDRVSLLAVLSILQQERQVNSSVTGGDFLRTRGLGDGIFMVKYAIKPLDIYSQYSFAVGGGMKFPIGTSDLRQNSALIAADMQPGTGSFDGIVWANFYKSMFRYFPGSINITAGYTLNGDNNRFGTTDDGYKFGNEFLTTASLNYQPPSRVDYTIGIRFRTTARDQFIGNDLPNTGGIWFALVPGLNYKMSEQMTGRLSSRVPIYQDLNGTQFTTAYTISLSLFYTMDKKQPDNFKR